MGEEAVGKNMGASEGCSKVRPSSFLNLEKN